MLDDNQYQWIESDLLALKFIIESGLDKSNKVYLENNTDEYEDELPMWYEDFDELEIEVYQNAHSIIANIYYALGGFWEEGFGYMTQVPLESLEKVFFDFNRQIVCLSKLEKMLKDYNFNNSNDIIKLLYNRAFVLQELLIDIKNSNELFEQILTKLKLMDTFKK